jgi:hypothetical protein
MAKSLLQFEFELGLEYLEFSNKLLFISIM